MYFIGEHRANFFHVCIMFKQNRETFVYCTLHVASECENLKKFKSKYFQLVLYALNFKTIQYSDQRPCDCT